MIGILDFLAAQYQRNNLLAKPFMAQVVAILPGNSVLNIEILPPPDMFASYGLHATVDPSVVPNTLRVDVQQYGAQPFFGTVLQGVTDHPLDALVKVTAPEPSFYQVTNLTGINQRWAVTFQGLHVANEDDDNELRRRLALYFRQIDLPTLQAPSPAR